MKENKKKTLLCCLSTFKIQSGGGNRNSGQRTEWNFNITKSARIIRRVGNTPINKHTTQPQTTAPHRTHPTDLK